jgi:hypothetical protein
MNTYKIIDAQTNEIVAGNCDLEELKEFANELFWDEDVTFELSDFNEVSQAISGCDYDLISE